MATSRTRRSTSTIFRRGSHKLPYSGGEGDSSCTDTATEQELIALMGAMSGERMMMNSVVSGGGGNNSGSMMSSSMNGSSNNSHQHCSSDSHHHFHHSSSSLAGYYPSSLIKRIKEDSSNIMIQWIPHSMRRMLFRTRCVCQLKWMHILMMMCIPMTLFIFLVFYGHWLFCSINWGMCFPIPMLLFPSFYDLSQLKKVSESSIISKSVSLMNDNTNTNDDSTHLMKSWWSDRPINEVVRSVHLQCRIDNEQNQDQNSDNNDALSGIHHQRSSTLTIFMVSGVHLNRLNQALSNQGLFDSISMMNDIDEMRRCFLMDSLTVWDSSFISSSFSKPSLARMNDGDDSNVQSMVVSANDILDSHNNNNNNNENDNQNGEPHLRRVDLDDHNGVASPENPHLCRPLSDHYMSVHQSDKERQSLGLSTKKKKKVNNAIIVDLDAVMTPFSKNSADFLRFTQNVYCDGSVTLVQIWSQNIRSNRRIQKSLKDYFYLKLRQPFPYLWIDDAALFESDSMSDDVSLKSDHEKKIESIRFRAARKAQIERLKAFLV